MHYDDLEDSKEEWQKDLNSWKRRRKSVSSLKHRCGDDDDGSDAMEKFTTTAEDNFVASKSLKNRKWNKFLSLEEDDYDYDVTVVSNTQQQQQHSQVAPQQRSISSSSSSSSSTSPPLLTSWCSSEQVSRVTHTVNSGARENGASLEIQRDREGHKYDEGIFQEKMIKINQRPNNPKGFGFEVEGGREKQLPVTVSRVVRGSSADVCGLKAKDTLLYLNGVDVSKHYKDSVNDVIEEATKKGSIELKIRRIRTCSEEVFSDEEELGIEMKPCTRWSGSQSSYRSTPPLPPQPDYPNDCFSESPQPLPLAPPPPVNWSTFPEKRSKSASSESTPTESEGVKPQQRNDIGTSPIELKQHFSGKPEQKTPTSPTYSNSSSSSSIKHPSIYLEENLTMCKFKFLGFEPEQSEELKLLKENSRPLETTSPATSDEEDNYNPHKYVAEYSAVELDQDANFRSRNTSKGEGVSGARAELSFNRPSGDKTSAIQRFHEDLYTDESVSRVRDKSMNCGQNSDEQPQTDAKKLSTFEKENDSKFGEHSWISNHSKNVITKDQGRKVNVKLGMSSTCENIEKVEVSRSAAAEWRKRDRELKEKEQNEKQDMQERFNKFKKESDNLLTFDSKNLTNQTNAKYFSRESSSSLIGNKIGDVQSSPNICSKESPLNSDKFGTSGQFGFKKSEYKPVKLCLSEHNSSLSTNNRSSPSSKSYDVPQEDLMKKQMQKNVDKREQRMNIGNSESSSFPKVPSTISNSFRPSFLSKSYEVPGDFMKNKMQSNNNMTEQENAHYPENPGLQSNTSTIPVSSQLINVEICSASTASGIQPQNTSCPIKDYHSANTDGFGGDDSVSRLKDSLREEELELQKVKEQQEIERMRLERIREERKVEELRRMRLKEEEEVQKMKEQRLKEENELEKQRQNRFDNVKNQADQMTKKEVQVENVMKGNTNTADDIKYLRRPSSSQKESVQGRDSEGNEGNPYARLARSILSEAGVPCDKTSVETVLLNKPNFFGGSNKKYPSSEQNFTNVETSRNKPQSSNTNRPKEAKVPTYSDYANLPNKSPVYFGPTFKRLNGSQANNNAVHHARSHSGIEMHSSRRPQCESNINYLLYGEDLPKERQTSLYDHENTKDVFSSGRDMNINSVSSDIYSNAKKMSKHWLVEESERRRKAEIESGLKRPSYFENQLGIRPRHSDAYFLEGSKSGSFQAHLNKVNSSRQPSNPKHDNVHEKIMSMSSYSSDSQPVSFTYSNFAQPPRRHSRSSSTDVKGKYLQSPKESTKAADILFPSKISSSSDPRCTASCRVNAISSNSGNDDCTQHGQYTSSAAVDSLFAYNISQNGNHKQATPNPQSSLSLAKRFSVSTTNLSHGAWENSSANHSRRAAMHGPSGRLGQISDDDNVYFRRPSTGSNYNKPPNQSFLGSRNY